MSKRFGRKRKRKFIKNLEVDINEKLTLILNQERRELHNDLSRALHIERCKSQEVRDMNDRLLRALTERESLKVNQSIAICTICRKNLNLEQEK